MTGRHADSEDTLRIQRRLLEFARPHRRIALLGMCFAAMTATVTLAVAWFLKRVIDLMARGDVRDIKSVCVMVLFVFMLKAITTFGQMYCLTTVANRIAADLRERLFEHLHALSIAHFNRNRTGRMMSLLTNDVAAIQNASMGLRDIVAAPLTLLGSLAMLFLQSWRLALVCLFIVPCMSIVVGAISRKMRAISRSVQSRMADVTTVMEETFAGVRVIKSFARERQESDRFNVESRSALEALTRGAWKTAQLRPLVELIGASGVALVLFLGGTEVAATVKLQEREQLAWIADHPLQNVKSVSDMPVPRGHMTQGGLLQFIYLLNAVAQAATNIGGIATLRAQALASAKRVFDEALDLEADITDKPGAEPLPAIRGNIEFRKVSFRYAPDSPNVLTDLNFQINPGEVVALVGRSGAGKSTLVDLVLRFYDPTAGSISIDGRDIRDVTVTSLRRQIGVVPQETWLFAGTLRDNIRYGRMDATEEQVRGAAYAANAYFVEGMERKFDTVVGERGIRLSGGEKQRIAIARAILMDPRLLILDEATSSLDASSEALVQEALDELMKGRTTIVIAHRLSTIINADRIFAMRDGEIVESGSHGELIAAGGYYAQLYDTQLRGLA